MIATAFRPLGVGGDSLPAGYTRLKYLESTGEQYINTGLLGGEFNDKWTQNESFADVIIYGNGRVLMGREFGNWFGRENNALSIAGGSPVGNIEYLNGQRVHLRFINHGNGQTSLFRDEEEVLRGTCSSGTFSGDFSLFTISSSSGYLGRWRMFSFKMSVVGILRVDMIPALDKNGVPCMYDKVTHRPFYSSNGNNGFRYEVA